MVRIPPRFRLDGTSLSDMHLTVVLGLYGGVRVQKILSCSMNVGTDQ